MANEWQDISKAPKDGTIVDLWFREAGRMTNYRWDRRGEEWESIIVIYYTNRSMVFRSKQPPDDHATHFRLPPPAPT